VHEKSRTPDAGIMRRTGAVTMDLKL
jgi:hypothetical protein